MVKYKIMKQQLITDTKIILEQGKGEFAINLSDSLYLADHAFQGMIVLPGSAYIEMALVIYDRLFNKVPGIIDEINFENIIVLSEKETKIGFEVISYVQ